MTIKTALTESMNTAAAKAGLTLLSATEGKDFHGHPTAVFELALHNAGPDARNLRLELSAIPAPTHTSPLPASPSRSRTSAGPSTAPPPARIPTSSMARSASKTAQNPRFMPSSLLP